MRILMIMPHTSNPSGGVESVAFNLVKGMSKISQKMERNDIYLDVMSYRGESYSRPLIKNFGENIRVFYFKILGHTPSLGEIQALLHASKLNMKKYDIVISHDVFSNIIGLAHKLPTFYNIHGIIWREKAVENKTSRAIGLSIDTFKFSVYVKMLTGIIAISPYVVEELKRAGYLKRRSDMIIEKIENPVSEEFFNIKRTNENIILFPAIISPRKNQLNFVKAYKTVLNEIRDAPYVILTGPIRDNRYFQYLQTLIKRLELEKSVRYLGKVPYKTLLSLYAQSAFVALTSLQETLPMTILEAMATGAPVLASNIEPIRYIVDPFVNGILVDPHTPKEIAEGIYTILTDENLRKKLSINAKKAAEKRWRSEAIANKWLEFFKSLETKN